MNKYVCMYIYIYIYSVVQTQGRKVGRYVYT